MMGNRVFAGKIVKIETPATIADGAQTPALAAYTFPVIQERVDNILTATDDQLISAMKFFTSRMKIVVEPTGCLGQWLLVTSWSCAVNELGSLFRAVMLI